MLFKKENKKEEQMYLCSCDILYLNDGNKIRIWDKLTRNEKDAKKWMKRIRENYCKNDYGELDKNFEVISTGEENVYECKNKDKNSIHYIYYRPVYFVEID